MSNISKIIKVAISCNTPKHKATFLTWWEKIKRKHFGEVEAETLTEVLLIILDLIPEDVPENETRIKDK